MPVPPSAAYKVTKLHHVLWRCSVCCNKFEDKIRRQLAARNYHILQMLWISLDNLRTADCLARISQEAGSDCHYRIFIRYYFQFDFFHSIGGFQMKTISLNEMLTQVYLFINLRYVLLQYGTKQSHLCI
jgi:hypothetical protein